MPDDIIEREVLGEATGPEACWSIGRGRVGRKGGATAGELSLYAARRFRPTRKRFLRALMAAASRREGGDVGSWVRHSFTMGWTTRDAAFERPSPTPTAMPSRRGFSRRCSRPS